MKQWRCILRWGVCLLTFGILLGRSGTAQADVAPMEPPYGTNPQPGSETTNVRMMAETVLMEVDSHSPYDEALVHVTASFTMRNLGETEEQMEVGFPLDQTTGWGNLCKEPYPFRPITDLKAWVNGNVAETTIKYEKIVHEPVTCTYTETVPCWEQFTVTFPPAQDVDIRIKYTGQPYDEYKSGTFVYSYVLFTGAGWKDTIGSADITVRMPYEINAYSYHGCNPNTCVVTDHEVQWHFEDFEPEFASLMRGIEAYFVAPPVWQTILAERINTTNNPKDGEAWGRLGKAYKNALGGFRGYNIGDEIGMEMYGWSMDAYQKALELLPNDADWHFGYAELICTEMEWNNDVVIRPEEVNWVTCLDQIRQT